LYLGYKRLKADIEEAKKDLAYVSKPDLLATIPNTWGHDLSRTRNKKRHFWVWSNGSSCGKTTFIEMLRDNFRASIYAYAEEF
jgi:hypothetical protein